MKTLNLYVESKKLEWNESEKDGQDAFRKLLHTSINVPVLICWPNAMQIIEGEESWRAMYSKFAAKRWLTKKN